MSQIQQQIYLGLLLEHSGYELRLADVLVSASRVVVEILQEEGPRDRPGKSPHVAANSLEELLALE